MTAGHASPAGMRPFAWRRAVLVLLLTLGTPLLVAPLLAEATGRDLFRVVTRLLSVGGALTLLAGCGFPDRQRVLGALGPQPVQRLMAASIVTLAVCLGLAAALYLSGVLVLRTEPSHDQGRKVLGYLLAALVIGVFEEGVFRGLLLGRLARRLYLPVAVLVSSLVFAWVHYGRVVGGDPEGAIGRSVLDVYWLIGDGLLRGPLRSPCDGIGLIFLGVLLAVVVRRVGGLAPAIGIHATLVFFTKADGKFLWWVHDESSIWLGSHRYQDGVLAWSLLVAATLVVWLRSSPEGRP